MRRLGVVVLLLLAACGSGVPSIGSGSTLVLYLHGAGAKPDPLDEDRLDRVAEVARVVSVPAGGDAWGSEAAADAYADVLADARSKWHPSRVVVLSESMGSLTAAQLLADRRLGRVDRWVAVSPVADVEQARKVPALRGSIEPRWPGRAPSWVSPAVSRPAALRGIPTAVLVGRDDPLTPAAVQAAVLAKAVGVTPQVCGVGHLPDGCYSPSLVLG